MVDAPAASTSGPLPGSAKSRIMPQRLTPWGRDPLKAAGAGFFQELFRAFGALRANDSN